MAVLTSVGGIQRTRTDRRRITKGYSAGRQAYDKRRRATDLTLDDKAYKLILRGDPCVFCGQRATGEAMAVDHIVPLASGGIDEWHNYAAVCRPCNAGKKNNHMLLWMVTRA